MNAKKKHNSKSKRHRKRKSRTEVVSDSDSESENQTIDEQTQSNSNTTTNLLHMTENEISVAFTEFYLQRVTSELSDDLNQLRKADDFKENSIPILVNALQQGSSLFSLEEQRRIVLAELDK